MPNTEKNVSLYPLEFEEAVELLLKVKPEKKENAKKPKKRVSDKRVSSNAKK
jgi:hypothetical protein